MAAKSCIIAAFLALISLSSAHITYSNHPQTYNAISDHPSYVKAANKIQIPLQQTSQPESARRSSISNEEPDHLIPPAWEEYMSAPGSDEEPSLIYDWSAPEHLLNSPHARCLYTVLSPRHALHGQIIDAANGRFWAVGETKSYFPPNALDLADDGCESGDKTIGPCNSIGLNTRALAGRYTYIGRDGSVIFTQAHSHLEDLCTVGYGSDCQLKVGVDNFFRISARYRWYLRLWPRPLIRGAI